MSVQILRLALKRSGLCLQQKKKKPLLSNKNIKTCVEFARIHEYWIVDALSRVIFLDK